VKLLVIKKVQRISISEQVFQQLRDSILSGEWKVNEKIPSENELTELFGVSRVTIRQALQKLTAIGLITTKMGEGSFVAELKVGMVMNQMIPAIYLNENSLNEILEFRRCIEGKVAELATEKATAEEIEQLVEIYAEMEKQKDNLEAFSKADYQFHYTLGKMTKNTLFIQLFGILHEDLSNAFSEIVTSRGNKAGLYYHKLILEAIKARDSKKAKLIMDEHMEDLYSTFYKK
jgi:GntR family transcriptional repressor for pyruvate dehydrogenase complex